MTAATKSPTAAQVKRAREDAAKAADVISAAERAAEEKQQRQAEARQKRRDAADDALIEKYDAVAADLREAGNVAAAEVIAAVEALDLSKVLPLEAKYHGATVARALLVERFNEARRRRGRTDLTEKREVRVRPSRLFSEGGMNGAGFGEGLLIEQVRKRSVDLGDALLAETLAAHGVDVEA